MEGKTKHKSIIVLQGALLLLFASVVLPTNLKSIAIGFFALVSLYHFLKNKNVFNKRFFVVNALVYICIIGTMIYSDNITYAIRKSTTMLSLLIFPLCFAMYSKDDISTLYKNLEKYLSIYLITVVVFNVVPFLYFFITKYSFDDMMIHFHTLIRVGVGKYGIHPIYISMHCGIAILFSMFVLRSLQSRWKIAGILVLDGILILFLLLYAKKGPILALMLVSLLFVLFQRRKAIVKPYVFAALGLVVLMIAIPRTRNKFLELQKIEAITEGSTTSTNIRYTVYGLASELIFDNPVVGYGIGDYREALQKKYEYTGNELLINGRYNAHNQFLSILLIGGVLLLLVFISTLAVNFVFAVRFNNELFILVLLFYGVVMLTDNILEREAGVVYFALFLNFFTSKTLFAPLPNA